MTQKRHVFPHCSFEPPPPSASGQWQQRAAAQQDSPHRPTGETMKRLSFERLLEAGDETKRSPPVSPREVTAEAPLRVLVAGGGLAGLVTAAAATSKGMQVSCHTM